MGHGGVTGNASCYATQRSLDSIEVQSRWVRVDRNNFYRSLKIFAILQLLFGDLLHYFDFLLLLRGPRPNHHWTTSSRYLVMICLPLLLLHLCLLLLLLLLLLLAILLLLAYLL